VKQAASILLAQNNRNEKNWLSFLLRNLKLKILFLCGYVNEYAYFEK